MRAAIGDALIVASSADDASSQCIFNIMNPMQELDGEIQTLYMLHMIRNFMTNDTDRMVVDTYLGNQISSIKDWGNKTHQLINRQTGYCSFSAAVFGIAQKMLSLIGQTDRVLEAIQRRP